MTDFEKAVRRSRVAMLLVRRAYGLGCDCGRGPNWSGTHHHWACGVNKR